MSTQFTYSDRRHAGRVLAEIIQNRHLENPVILALPRGGIPIAKEISETLQVPLDVLIVRKIGAPYDPEYGIGAMCEDFFPLLNAEDVEVKEIIDAEKVELKRRIKLYRGSRNLPDVKNKNVILVDDGLATGVTAIAAAKFLKAKGAKKILLAVPVGPQRVSEMLKRYVNEIICPYRPLNFTGIGGWYKDFHQVTDDEVMSILSHFHPTS